MLKKKKVSFADEQPNDEQLNDENNQNQTDDDNLE